MIPAALLVVALPLIGALPSILLRRWRSIELLVAILTCGIVLIVLSQPPDIPISVLGVEIKINAPLNVLGRVLQVRSNDRATLLLLFLSAVVLFACAWGVAQSWSYIPVGLVSLSLLSAALLVRPFVFAALAFEAAAAVSVLMIQAERTGERSTAGATRYLTVTTLALPVFLGAGYVIRQATAISDPIEQLIAFTPAIDMLVVGFAFLLGALPLFTWIHSVAKYAPPLATAFLVTVANSAAMLLLLDFCQEFPWFATSPILLGALQFGGVLLIVMGGLLAWAQNSFARVWACALLIDIGSMLMAAGSSSATGVGAVAFNILARALSLGLFGIGLSILRQRAFASDRFEDIRGLGFDHRWAAFALGAGGLSLVGIPGTIGFVARWMSARAIGIYDVNGMAIMVLACVSVGVGVARGMAQLFNASWREAAQRSRNAASPTITEMATLLVMAASVMFFGLFPNALATLAQSVANSYTFYQR